MTAWEITLPYTKPPLTANTSNRGISRGARMAQAEAAANLRAEIRYLSRHIPPQEAIHVQLHYRPKDNRRRDPDNLVATLKPCLDGLVDSAVVRDDTSEYVDWSRPVIHRASLPDRKPLLWLVVTSVVATAPAVPEGA